MPGRGRRRGTDAGPANLPADVREQWTCSARWSRPPSPVGFWDGYDPLQEATIESRFAVGNGFLGVRGARAVSRGPMWISWLHHVQLEFVATHRFAGFFGLGEIDLAPYAGRTMAIELVLGRERAQRSQVVKQADVVALVALLPDEFDRRTQTANFRYYEPRLRP